MLGFRVGELGVRSFGFVDGVVCRVWEACIFLHRLQRFSSAVFRVLQLWFRRQIEVCLGLEKQVSVAFCVGLCCLPASRLRGVQGLEEPSKLLSFNVRLLPAHESLNLRNPVSFKAFSVSVGLR